MEGNGAIALPDKVNLSPAVRGRAILDHIAGRLYYAT